MATLTIFLEAARTDVRCQRDRSHRLPLRATGIAALSCRSSAILNPSKPFGTLACAKYGFL